jgi:DNA-binding NtrC family response regulator
MRRVLLIHHSKEIKDLVKGALDPTEIDLAQTDSYTEGLQLIREAPPEVVIARLNANDPGDLDGLSGIGELDARLPAIVISSGEEAPTVPADGKTSVFDLVLSPIDPADLARTVWHALQTVLDGRSSIARGAPAPSNEFPEAVIGHNAAMKFVCRTIERLANSNAGALIRGESGTGKSLVARCIHHLGKRRDRFMITVDCMTPRDILERELFGHPRLHRVSRLDAAAGGTLFLHHVDRMPLPTQARLLEWFEEQARSPFGNYHGRAKVRTVAATTVSLEEAVAARAFREDLLRILGAVRVILPPLRDRLEDIPWLASYFLRRIAAETGQPGKSLSPIVSRVLAQYRWPENVRELESLLRRASAFATSDVIQLGDLPAGFLNAIAPALVETPAPDRNSGNLNGAELVDLSGLSTTLFQWARKDTQLRLIPAMERELIIHAMAETEGNQAQAAKLLGITRATLRKRLHRFNIQREVSIY